MSRSRTALCENELGDHQRGFLEDQLANVAYGPVGEIAVLVRCLLGSCAAERCVHEAPQTRLRRAVAPRGRRRTGAEDDP